MANRQVKIFGMEFPIKKWAVGALSVIVVCLGVFMVWIFINNYFKKDERSSYIYQQMRESSVRFTESAQDIKIIFDDERGKVQASFYTSDGCIALARYVSGASKAYSLQWIFDRKRAGESPGSLGDAKESTPTFGFAFGGEARNPCAGVCLNPHPKIDKKGWWGETRGCWIAYHTRWVDNCEVYIWYNKCYGIWDLKSYWVCCVH